LTDELVVFLSSHARTGTSSCDPLVPDLLRLSQAPSRTRCRLRCRPRQPLGLRQLRRNIRCFRDLPLQNLSPARFGLHRFFAIFLKVSASLWRLLPGGQVGPPNFGPVQTPAVPRFLILALTLPIQLVGFFATTCSLSKVGPALRPAPAGVPARPPLRWFSSPSSCRTTCPWHGPSASGSS
jgi:hypothetical protein